MHKWIFCLICFHFQIFELSFYPKLRFSLCACFKNQLNTNKQTNKIKRSSFPWSFAVMLFTFTSETITVNSHKNQMKKWHMRKITLAMCLGKKKPERSKWFFSGSSYVTSFLLRHFFYSFLNKNKVITCI